MPAWYLESSQSAGLFALLSSVIHKTFLVDDCGGLCYPICCESSSSSSSSSFLRYITASWLPFVHIRIVRMLDVMEIEMVYTPVHPLLFAIMQSTEGDPKTHRLSNTSWITHPSRVMSPIMAVEKQLYSGSAFFSVPIDAYSLFNGHPSSRQWEKEMDVSWNGGTPKSSILKDLPL